MTAKAKLRAHRKERNLSLSEAARELGVSHVAYRSWERGQAPTEANRRLIEEWTGGAVLASLWPPTRAERQAQARQQRIARQRAGGAAA